MRPHLDYADVIFDKAFNISFHQGFESFQHNAALVITGATTGNLKEKNTFFHPLSKQTGTN